MKIWNFINGLNWKGVLSRGSTIMCLLVMAFNGTQSAFAAEDTLPDTEFLEFLGEGIQVENEIIDPMGYHEIEKMTGKDQQQGKPEGENE